MSAADPVEAYLVTGFLGSGKTTLLRGLLASPAFADTAVIVNELGTVGLDHELLSFSADSTLVMPGGCLCCTIREDIEVALRQLFAARDAGRIPPFRRLVIETSGLAEPLPLLMTLHANPLALERLRRPQTIAVVDGLLGLATLAAQPEAEAQVVHADRILLSKADLAGPEALAALTEAVRALNPWAPVTSADLETDCLEELFRPAAAAPAGEDWLRGRQDHRAAATERHGAVRTHSVTLERPLDWTGFGVWTTLLLHRHGDRVLRVKGILDVDGLPGPTVFQSAQHLVHPPQHLAEWPSAERRSRLVFILRGLDPALLQASLAAFDHAARTAPVAAAQDLPAGAGGSIAGRPVRRATAPRWMKG